MWDQKKPGQKPAAKTPKGNGDAGEELEELNKPDISSTVDLLDEVLKKAKIAQENQKKEDRCGCWV